MLRYFVYFDANVYFDFGTLDVFIFGSDFWGIMAVNLHLFICQKVICLVFRPTKVAKLVFRNANLP